MQFPLLSVRVAPWHVLDLSEFHSMLCPTRFLQVCPSPTASVLAQFAPRVVEVWCAPPARTRTGPHPCLFPHPEQRAPPPSGLTRPSPSGGGRCAASERGLRVPLVYSPLQNGPSAREHLPPSLGIAR